MFSSGTTLVSKNSLGNKASAFIPNTTVSTLIAIPDVKANAKSSELFIFFIKESFPKNFGNTIWKYSSINFCFNSWEEKKSDFICSCSFHSEFLTLSTKKLLLGIVSNTATFNWSAEFNFSSKLPFKVSISRFSFDISCSFIFTLNWFTICWEKSDFSFFSE